MGIYNEKTFQKRRIVSCDVCLILYSSKIVFFIQRGQKDFLEQVRLFEEKMIEGTKFF